MHRGVYFPKQSSAVGVLTVLVKGPWSASRHVDGCPSSFFIKNTNESETDLQKHLVKLTQKGTFQHSVWEWWRFMIEMPSEWPWAPGCLLGASWLPLGCLLGASWVPPLFSSLLFSSLLFSSLLFSSLLISSLLFSSLLFSSLLVSSLLFSSLPFSSLLFFQSLFKLPQKTCLGSQAGVMYSN